MLKLLTTSLQQLFAMFEKEETLKKACVRNLWTVLRPNLSEKRFVQVREQPWAEGLKFGTHRLKQSWVDKRYDHLDEDGFPKKPEAVKLPEVLKDCSYHGEEGSLQELSTWKLMVKKGEMTEEAMKELSLEPWLSYEVQGMLDSEALQEAKELMVSPKKRRLEAGIDPLLTQQGPTEQTRKKRRKRYAVNAAEREEKVQNNIEKMRGLEKEGYDVRQVQLQTVVPQAVKI